MLRICLFLKRFQKNFRAQSEVLKYYGPSPGGISAVFQRFLLTTALFTAAAYSQSITITSISPNATIHPSDVVQFTITITKTPPTDTKFGSVTVKLMETINNGTPRQADLATASFNSNGVATAKFSNYSVPDYICGTTFQAQCKSNPASLSDQIQNTVLQITASATGSGSTITAPAQTVTILPATASLNSTQQTLNSQAPIKASLGSNIGGGGGVAAGIVLYKSQDITGCGKVNVTNGPFNCILQAYVTSPGGSVGSDGHSFTVTLDTTIRTAVFNSEEDNVKFIGGYDVLISWHEDVPAGNGFRGGSTLRQALNQGAFTITPPPADDGIVITKVTGFTQPTISGPQTPFTWLPGQTPVLSVPPGGRLTVSSVEGTYKLDKYYQALIFPVLKANGHYYGVGYSIILNTFTKDQALGTYNLLGTRTGPTYAFIDLPKDPILSFEFLLLMSPPDEKITDFTGSNVVDFLTTRSFAKSASISGTGAITSDLMITHMFVTQAIQTPQEFVTLIGGKRTVARVFIKSVGPAAQPVTGVSARLRCSNAGDIQNYGASPGTGPITAQPIASPPDPSARPNLAEPSIDFVIPAQCNVAQNAPSVTAEIVLPPGVTDPDLSNNTLTRTLAFVTPPGSRPFRIGWVRIPYQPPGQAAATNATDGVSSADTLLRLMYPVPEDGVRYFPLTLDYPAWTHPLLTSEQWAVLLSDFAVNISLSDLPAGENYDQVVGWLPNIPGAGIVGKADTKWSGGEARVVLVSDYGALGRITTVPHEIGHNLGLRHTNQNDPANGCTSLARDDDTAWPFPNPTIQVQGYYTFTMQVVPPTQYDYMSYCPDPTLWTSPYSAEALYQNGLVPTAQPRHIVFGDLPMKAAAHPPDYARRDALVPVTKQGERAASTQDLWLVTGLAFKGGTAQLDPFLRVTSSRAPAVSDPNGDYCLTFTGGGSSFCFTVTFRDSENVDVTQKPFNFLIPVVPNATQVTLVKGGQNLASISAQPGLNVSITQPQAGDRWQGGMQTIRWTSNAGSQGRYGVQYSPDGGTSWLALANKLTDTQITIDSSHLQGGDQIRFRVLAGSGLSTASAEVGPISIQQTPRIAVVGAPLDLHSAIITQGVERTFAISNTGTGPLRITAIDSSNPQFRIASPVLPAVILAGSTAPLVIRFTPTASGSVTGSINLTSNDPSQPTLSVALTGKGVDSAAPEIALDQTALDFGSVLQGQSSTKTIVVTNFGSADLNVLSISASGPFTLSQNPAPVTISAGGTATLTVRFAPAATGAATGTLTVASNDLSRSSIVVKLTGTGLSPGDVKLPTLKAGTPVVNAATFAVGLTRGALGTVFGTDLANDRVTQTDTPWVTILAGAKVTIAGILCPLYFVSNGQINFQVPFEAPLGPATLIVSRDGFESAPVTVTISDYAPGVFQYARTASALDPIVVHSSTNQLITPTSPAAGSEYLIAYLTGVGKLTVTPQTGYGSPSSPLAASADAFTGTIGNLPVNVIFAGMTPGFVGLIQVNFQMPGTLPSGTCAALLFNVAGVSSAPVNLATGPGGCAPAAAPSLTLGATSIVYGPVTVGTTSDKTVTLQNTGNAALSVSALAISGAGYTVVSPQTPFSIAAGGSQNVTVRFAPTAAGPSLATLNITSNDPQRSTAAVSLNGTGVAQTSQAPAIDVSPASLDFGSVASGQTKDLTFKVTNNGNAVLTVSSVTSSNPRFAMVLPGTPFNVDQGGSFQFVTIRFSPNASSSQTGSITIASNDPQKPSIQVAVTGNAASGGGPSTINSTLTVTGTATISGGNVSASGTVSLSGIGTGTFSSNFNLLAAAGTGTAPVTFNITNGTPSGTLTGTVAGSLALLAQVLAGNPNSSGPATITISSGTAGFAGATGAFNVTATGTGTRDTSSGSFTLTGPGTITIPGSGGGASGGTIAVTPAATDFGSVNTGSTKDIAVTIANTAGSGVLSVTPGISPNPPFSIVGSPAPLSINAGTSQTLTVRFSPTTAGAQNGTLTLTTTDTAHPTVTVQFNGTGAASGVGVPGTISVGQTVTGRLSSSSGTSVDCNTCYADRYTLTLTGTQRLRVLLRSTEFDAFLQILDSNGKILVVDDDDGGGPNGTDALIATTFTAGKFVIEVTTANTRETGAYTLSVTPY